MSHRFALRLCVLALFGFGVAACAGKKHSQTSEVTLEEVKASRDAVCTAVGCDPNRIDCQREIDEFIVQADASDCLEILDTWLRCLAAVTTCENGLASRGDACDEEEELAEDCRKGRL